ncbi:hypothetical protein Taro_008609 [Colocasia esculenta]|uniref:CCHC-type domain-containing protein n=1 Tax=Colocasia esculenta TaxID=4460 RepID=A0A843TYP8_COLES|nr:hypothetical protein [Colocasia esculenta]
MFEEQRQVPVSPPEQDAPEETINEVLRDLRGKGVAQDEDNIPSSTPDVQEFVERQHHSSPSQFGTRPRSQGESSNSLSTILDLLNKQQESLSVLHLQVKFFDAKFDGLADEVKQMKDLLLQLVCQQGTTQSPATSSTPLEEQPSAPQHQEAPVQKLFKQEHRQQEQEKGQQPKQQSKQQQQQEQEPVEVLPLVEIEDVQQKDQQQQPSITEQLPTVEVEKSKIKTFKRKVKRRLHKNGHPVFSSPPPEPTALASTTTTDPAPITIAPPEPAQPPASSSQPTTPTPSTDEQPPPPISYDHPPSTSIIEDQPIDFGNVNFKFYPLKYKFEQSKASIPVLQNQPPHFFSSLPTASTSVAGRSTHTISNIIPSIQLSSVCGKMLKDNPTKLLPPFWYAFIYHSEHHMNLFREFLSIKAFLEVHEMPGFTFEDWLPTLIHSTQVVLSDLQLISQKCHNLSPKEFLDLYPVEAANFQQAQTRTQYMDIHIHLNLRFYDIFGTVLRDSQAKYFKMKEFNFSRFKLGLPDVSKGQWEKLFRGQRPISPSMSVALPSGLYPSLVGAISARKEFADHIFNRCNKPGHMKGECLENKKEKHKKIHKFKKPKAMVATWSDEDSREKEEEEKSSSSESEEIYFMANSSDGKARSTLPPSSVDTLQLRSTLTSSSVDTYPCQGDSSRGHRLGSSLSCGALHL